MSADDLNDVRLALGAIATRLTNIEATVAELAAAGDVVVRVAELLDDADRVVEALPGLLAGLADNPMISMIAGPLLGQLGDVAASIRPAGRELAGRTG